MNKRNGEPLKSKIITVIHVASGDLLAGAEIMLYQLASAQIKSPKLKLYVVLLNHGKLETKLKQSGIKTIIIDENNNTSLQILFKLIKIFLKIKPNIVHTHRTKENILASLALLISLRSTNSLRTVHGSSEHNNYFYSTKQMLTNFIDKICANHLQQKIVAVSDELNIKLRQVYNNFKILTIENGIDFNKVDNEPRTKIVLPGPKKNIKIAFIGRLAPVKRVDLFIELAHYFYKMNLNNYSFYIFGDGPLKNDVDIYLASLPEDMPIYAMGFKDNIQDFLRKMDILLITSDHEGLPIIALEAIIFKIPIISHSVGGIPKLLGFGKYGTLIDRQDVKLFMQEIINYKNNKKYYTNQSDKAYDYARANYSIENCASRYINIYEEILSRKAEA